MAEVKISQFPSASALTGSETVPLVQNGVTVKTPISAISAKVKDDMTPLVSADYGNNTISVDKLTQAARDFIGSGGNIVNYPDDKTIESFVDGGVNKLRVKYDAMEEIAFYTDFNETGDTVLGQGGNLALADYIFGTGGNYLLNNAGYAAKLNPTNPTLFSDGATAPLDGSKGHEMTLLPGFHYLVGTNSLGKPRFWVSNKNIGGRYQAPQWIGTHKGYVTGGRLLSRSGVVPTGGLTISQFFAAAQVNGSNFGLANYTMRKTLALMFFAKYGTTQSQGGTVLGEGLSGVGSSYDNIRNIATGKANSLGDGTGYVPIQDAAGNTVGSTSVFGVKDPFGQVWEFCGGVASLETTFYLSDDNVTPVDGTPTTWTNMRTIPKLASAGGQYITSMRWGEYADMLPKAVGGSSTTYYTDCAWSATSGRVLLFGGSAFDGPLCGLVFASAHYAFGIADASVGARLGFYGTATIVSGTKFLTL